MMAACFVPILVVYKMACTFIGAKLRKKLELYSLKKDGTIAIPKLPLPM